MSKEYVEPIVADNSGNVYISIKTANKYKNRKGIRYETNE